MLDDELAYMNSVLMDGFQTEVIIHHKSGDVPSKGIFDEKPSKFSKFGNDFLAGQSIVEMLEQDADGIVKDLRLTIKGQLYTVDSHPILDDGMVVLALKKARSKTNESTPDFRY